MLPTNIILTFSYSPITDNPFSIKKAVFHNTMVAYWRYVWESFGWNPVELQAVSLDWSDPELIQLYQNIKEKFSEPQFAGNIYWVYCSLRWVAYKRWMEANRIKVITVSDTDMIGYGLTPEMVNYTPTVNGGFFTPQWGFHVVTLECVNDFILQMQDKDLQRNASSTKGFVSDMHMGQILYSVSPSSPINQYLFHYANDFLIANGGESNEAYRTQDANALLTFLIKHARSFNEHGKKLFKDHKLKGNR